MCIRDRASTAPRLTERACCRAAPCVGASSALSGRARNAQTPMRAGASSVLQSNTLTASAPHAATRRYAHHIPGHSVPATRQRTVLGAVDAQVCPSATPRQSNTYPPGTGAPVRALRAGGTCRQHRLMHVCGTHSATKAPTTLAGADSTASLRSPMVRVKLASASRWGGVALSQRAATEIF